MNNTENNNYIDWLKLLLLYLEIGLIISIIGMIIGGRVLNFVTAFICALTAITSLVVAAIYKKTLEEVSFSLSYVCLLLIGAALYSSFKYYFNLKLAMCLFILFFITLIVFGIIYIYLVKKDMDIINFKGTLYILSITTFLIIISNITLLKLSYIGFVIYLIFSLIFIVYLLANLFSFKKAVINGKINEKEDLGIYVINIYLYII